MEKEDIKHLILKAVTSQDEFKVKFKSIRQEIAEQNKETIKIYLDTILNIITDKKAALDSRFYALFSLKMTTEHLNPTLNSDLFSRTSALKVLQEQAAFDHEKEFPERGDKFFSSNPTAKEQSAGRNFLALLLEMIKYWDMKYGSSDKGKDNVPRELYKELAEKGKIPFQKNFLFYKLHEGDSQPENNQQASQLSETNQQDAKKPETGQLKESNMLELFKEKVNYIKSFKETLRDVYEYNKNPTEAELLKYYYYELGKTNKEIFKHIETLLANPTPENEALFTDAFLQNQQADALCAEFQKYIKRFCSWKEHRAIVLVMLKDNEKSATTDTTQLDDVGIQKLQHPEQQEGQVKKRGSVESHLEEQNVKLLKQCEEHQQEIRKVTQENEALKAELKQVQAQAEYLYTQLALKQETETLKKANIELTEKVKELEDQSRGQQDSLDVKSDQNEGVEKLKNKNKLLANDIVKALKAHVNDLEELLNTEAQEKEVVKQLQEENHVLANRVRELDAKLNDFQQSSIKHEHDNKEVIALKNENRELLEKVRVLEDRSKDQAQKKEKVQSAQQKNIQLFVYDADTRNPIANAQITVEEINLRLLTDKEGRCTFPVNCLSKGILTISMDNYFEISKEYGPDILDIQVVNKMKFPLIKRPGHDEYHFRFLTDHEDEEFIKLDAITNDKQGKNLKIEKKQNFLELKNVTQRSGIYRIVATISNPELFLNPDNKFIISAPEDYGMIDIPLLPEDLLASKVVYWDIIFISAPDLRLVEINAYSTVMPKVTDYIKQYQSLVKFLHNSKSVDIKGILGFNSKERELAEGDIFVPLKTVLSSLDKYGFEIEDKLGLSHLLQSARVPGEMYSYGVLARKFSEIQPPFNFIADGPKNEVVNEDEYEYLDNFEDNGQ